MAESPELFSGSGSETSETEAENESPVFLPRTPPSKRPATEAENESPLFLPRTPPIKRPRADTSVRQLLPRFHSEESAYSAAAGRAEVSPKSRSAPLESEPSTSMSTQKVPPKSWSAPPKRQNTATFSSLKMTPKSRWSALLQQILQELQSNTKYIRDLNAHVTSVESNLKEPQCVGAKEKGKQRTPPSRKLRADVRRTYKALTEEDEDFQLDIGAPLSSENNQTVTKKLIGEVKAMQHDVSVTLIQDAAHTYFASLESGKYYERRISQRRKNRVIRKLEKRRAALQKTAALKKEVKEKWKPTLHAEMMSSEDSEWEEDNEGNRFKTFISRPIPWRAEKVSNFLHALDHKVKKSSTDKSAMMTFGRRPGLPTDREKPEGLPDWLFKVTK